MGILVVVVAGFGGGVFVRSIGNVPWEVTAFVGVVAVLVGVAAFLKPRLVYSLGAVFCLCFVLGAGRAAVADTPLPETFVHDLKQRVSYEGVVVGDPDIREKNQRIALEIYSGENSAGALAVMPLPTHCDQCDGRGSADVAVGDRVRVYGTLSLPQAFETENGRTFRYDKYLEARGIRFLIQFGSIHTIEPAPWYSLPAALARIKHAFLEGLGRALPKPDSALAGGIVIGGKQGLGAELQDAFTHAGLIQIIVLSGYNVMIVAEWVMAFLTLFALPKKLRYGAGAAALLLFIGIAGLSATALRATIMALIALYARASGRSYTASRALLFAVLLMLLWNPLYLAFDPGFGLSVAATAGIIWLAPLIEARLMRFSPFWRNTVATTLAAQISVLPLLLYNIGLLSLIALPANLLVNPLVPLAMGLAALTGVVGMTLGSFVPVIATVAGVPTHLFMRYFIFVAEKSSSLPFAAVDLPLFSFWFVLAAYAALIYIASSKRFSITPQFTLAKKAST